MVDRLEQRLREAAPQPRTVPDAAELWARGRRLRRRQHTVVGAVVAAAFVAVAALGTSLIPSDGALPPILDQPDGVVSPDPDDFDDGHAWQDAVLADGEVTYEEYLRAMGQTVDCIRAEGYEVDFRPDDPAAGPQSSAYFGADPSLMPAYGVLIEPHHDELHRERVMGECHGEWASDIESAWARHLTPDPSEQRAIFERVWDCAEQRGMELSQPPTEHDAIRAMEYGCHPVDLAD